MTPENQIGGDNNGQKFGPFKEYIRDPETLIGLGGAMLLILISILISLGAESGEITTNPNQSPANKIQ